MTTPEEVQARVQELETSLTNLRQVIPTMEQERAGLLGWLAGYNAAQEPQEKIESGEDDDKQSGS